MRAPRRCQSKPKGTVLHARAPGGLTRPTPVQRADSSRTACTNLVARVAAVEPELERGPTEFPGVSVPKTTKPRIVVLGSGWGAISFMKALRKDVAQQYDVVLLSPRNYFLYTPLLPAVATGTMEERSIVEPIRNVVVGKGDYYEAACQSVDPIKKTITACFPKDAGFPEACFRMTYDHLIVSVGSVNNTFGVSGVEDHCFFFKSIGDANRLRWQLSECFERAALPYTPEEDRKKLLSFVIVGGGPTGVEVAAEVYDMVTDDMKRLYPDLMKDVKIRIVELMDHVLSTYDRKIGEYTAKLFKRNGIELILNARVSAVEDGAVKVEDKEGNSSEIPFGACVWATGVAMNPLIKQMQSNLENQTHFRALLTDDKLRVLGSGDSIWAIGDASTISSPRALDYADELFEEADTVRDGVLSLSELRAILEKASERFPQFEEHAKFLNVKGGGIFRFGGIVRNAFSTGNNGSTVFADITDESRLTREQFKDVLKTIDLGLRGLPATAQVARQQGEWLAHSVFKEESMILGEGLPESIKPFDYKHKGSLAYVSRDRAVMDAPILGPLYGLFIGVVWKGFETYSQFSLRNKALVTIDWLRTKAFGRDISRV